MRQKTAEAIEIAVAKANSENDALIEKLEDALEAAEQSNVDAKACIVRLEVEVQEAESYSKFKVHNSVKKFVNLIPN